MTNDLTEKTVAETLKDFDLDAEKLLSSIDPETLTDEEAAALYEEVVEIDAAIETLTERKEAIKARYRKLDYGTATVHPSGGKITVGANPQFDKERFVAAHPYDEEKAVDIVIEDSLGRKKVKPGVEYPNRKLYKVEPDRTAIKKHLSEEDAKSFYNEGTKKITIR